ncbi:MAG: metalloregulator ArsR/SmtB family transcription factor [Deltaproteobacteria bacterium]|nr:metalloregulator ArsR/SmtB family transcription factor [Deltaproteobacteria bacterium]
MRASARFFKSLSDETRLKILWLLSGTEELCVCDVIDVLGITQSKASRHLRYLYHLGWVTDRRDGLWMNYRLAVTPNSPREKLLKLLEEILAPQPEAQALRGQLALCLETKRHTECAKRLKSSQKRSLQELPET